MNYVKIMMVKRDKREIEQLRDIIQSVAAYELVGICDNGQDAVRGIAEKNPDIVILDEVLPGKDVLEIAESVIHNKNLKNVKSYQLFFGRYLLFFVMGQLQALIIVLGDIYILHCQILYPGWFWLVASLASVTFTLLIYSLALSFGDVGKALAVVIMVIQIAGSGGTFPIELLPAVYRNIYIFFPFPYAINAMRETIGGMYGSDYMKNLAELMIFAVVGLLIGLVIRIPFVKLNHFVEKRMEDTKMM